MSGASGRTVLRGALALTMDPDLGVVQDPEIVLEAGRIVSVRSRRSMDDDRRRQGPGSAPGGDDGDPGSERRDPSDHERGGLAGAGRRDPAARDGDRVLDLPGRWFLPGLVNAHTHAAMTLLRGFADDLPLDMWLQDRIWPVERHMDRDAVYAGTLLAAGEMLAGGVTTFADMYLYMDGAAKAVAVAGIRASLAHGLFESMGPTDETLDHAADFARRWHGRAGGRITVKLGPHAVYTCSPAFLEEIAAAARDLGVGTHIHLAETRDEVEGAREKWGASPVAIAAEASLLETDCVAAHCVWVDEHDIRLLREAGAGVAHNARSNMKLASGVAPVPDLLEAGIPVGLGTDGAASTNQLTLFEEMRSASLLQKVTRSDPTALPAGVVLEMATLGGARALGLDEDIGSLTPGKRADVVAVRADRPGTLPVHDPWSTAVYSMQDQDVEWVFCDGEPVARDGQPLTFDVADARDGARERADRLLAEAGLL